MRHLPALIDVLKDQVQELGSRDVNCGCGDGPHGEGLAHRTQKKKRARHSDRDAVEGIKRCDHCFRRRQARQQHERRWMRGVFGQVSWAHSDASSWDFEASADVAGRIVREPFHVPARNLQPSKFSGERVGQRVKAFLVQRLPARQWPLARRRLLCIPTKLTRQDGRRCCVWR